MITSIAFIFLSIMAIAGAIMMLASKSPVNSILWLIVVFFAISGHYILLNAQFLAVVNIIVYAGAIMVLFLFVVMLMNLNAETEPAKNHRQHFISIISGGCLLLILLAALINFKAQQPVLIAGGNAGLIKTLGQVLFRDYVIPFELSSALFLSAMVGAVVISKKDKAVTNEK
jgi:NADH-quinone oxidoreductase subunit J